MKRSSLFLFLLSISLLILPFALVGQDSFLRAVGQTLLPIETYSFEGLPVSLRPAQGKAMLILYWRTTDPKSNELASDTIVLYRRFHDAGLEVVSVCTNQSEDRIEQFSNRWQIPWPQVLDDEEDTPITTQTGVKDVPANTLIDSDGKIQAVDVWEGEAHEAVLKTLGLDASDYPMPETPTEREINTNIMGGMVSAPAITGINEGVLMRRETIGGYGDVLGTKEEREEAKVCREHFTRILLAIERYKSDHDGDMPDWLSDLYPKYIEDKPVFLCSHGPNRSGVGVLTNPGPPNDPNLPCSYIYEFSSAPGQEGTYKEWKTKQLDVFGDSVPMVRCFYHPRSLNLTYGGQIVFYDTIWEEQVSKGHSLNDPEAKVRATLRKIGVAIDSYKKKHGEVPSELDDLLPDYLPDEASIQNPVTETMLYYQFSPKKYLYGGYSSMREWKTAQMEEFGEMVPIVRARGLPGNAKVINLAYSGEVWDSQSVWENDLNGMAIEKMTAIRRLRFVPRGSEDDEIENAGWNQRKFTGTAEIDEPDEVMPLRGIWFLTESGFRHENPEINQSALLFFPWIEQGEIRMRIRCNQGSEGFRIVFGYQNSSDYKVWNVGGWTNTCSVVEQWKSVHDRMVSDLSPRENYSIQYGKWYDVRLSVEGNKAVGFIDGKKVMTFEASEPLSGRMGISTWLTDVEFDEIQMECK